ncbi:hypothetical protein GCM10022206_66050 [Streptomyces chiangmaiensis]
MVLEEMAAARRAEPVAAVEQPLVDGAAGECGTGAVPEEQGAQRGRVRHGGGTDERGTRQMSGHKPNP